MRGQPQTRRHYEVGKFYEVLCVRAAWPNSDDKPRWWPVLRPQHEDGDFIQFPYQHFHVDFRFLDADSRRLESGALRDSLAFSCVITSSNILPEDGRNERSEGLPTSAPTIGQIAEAASWLRSRRLKCKAQWPAYPPAQKVHWLAPLERAYKDRRLMQGRYCPHKGTDVSTIALDGDAVTCPPEPRPSSRRRWSSPS